MWDNRFYWCDGIYFDNTNVYIIKDPSKFSDTKNGTNITTRPTAQIGYITAMFISSESGYEYIVFPKTVNGSSDTYICDIHQHHNKNSYGKVLYLGGVYPEEIPDETVFMRSGLFRINGLDETSFYYTNRSCRLMKL